MTAARYPAPRAAWTWVAVLIVTAIISYTDRQVLSLLVDPIRQDLRIDDTQMSLLMGSAFALIYGVAGLPLGFLADRVSRRRLIVAGLVVWSLATIAGGFAQSFGELFAARVFVGLGEAALSPAAISLISDCFPPERRGFAVACFLSGIAIGSGAAVMVGGAALEVANAGLLAATPLGALSAWRLVLLLVGVPGLLWSLAILLLREPDRHVQVAEGGASAVAVSRVQIAALYLIVALASLVDNAVGAWAPSLLIRDFGKSASEVGLLLGLLLTLGFGGGVLAGGALSDRARDLPRQMLICMAVPALILLAALIPLSRTYLATLWSIPLYFLLSGAVTATGFAAILAVTPPQRRGLAMSVSFFLNVALGGGLGPTAVALAKDHIFGADGLAPAISATIVGGYGLVLIFALVARLGARHQSWEIDRGEKR